MFPHIECLVFNEAVQVCEHCAKVRKEAVTCVTCAVQPTHTEHLADFAITLSVLMYTKQARKAT